MDIKLHVDPLHYICLFMLTSDPCYIHSYASLIESVSTVYIVKQYHRLLV